MFNNNYSGGYLGNYSYGVPSPNMNNQNFMNYGQNYQPVNQPTGIRFNINPVASIEEAKALQTPMDGSILYLVNGSKGEIYSKSLAPNGAVDFRIYTQKKEEVVDESQVALANLQKRVESLEKLFEEQKQVVVQTTKKKGGSDE